MGSTNVSIREGRNPAWRIAWRGLDEEDREEVRAAFSNGTRMEDSALEPFAQGYLAREERGLRWLPLQFVAMTCICGVWLYATAVLRPSYWAWFWVVFLLVVLVCGPVLYRRAHKRLNKARQAWLQAD